ncbi:MAG: hypothetical protein Q8R64_17365 [Sulfurimicrobium sp.]|nr:hypothetical protein [Sulfurimicrobium sp.]
METEGYEIQPHKSKYPSGALFVTAPLDRIEALAGQQIHRAVLWIMAILAASLAFILAVLAWSERQRRNVSRLSRQASHDALTGAASSAVGVSIGIGIAPIRGKAANPKALIEAAGAACYVAKKMGKNSVFVSEAWPQDDPIRNLTNRVDLAALASFAAGRAVPPLFPIRPYTPLHTGKMQRVILKTRTHALLWRHR